MRRVFVIALALLLPACAEVQTGTAEAERTVARVSPAGPISIIYRDDESNERILNGNVSYDSEEDRVAPRSHPIVTVDPRSGRRRTVFRSRPSEAKSSSQCRSHI